MVTAISFVACTACGANSCPLVSWWVFTPSSCPTCQICGCTLTESRVEVEAHRVPLRNSPTASVYELRTVVRNETYNSSTYMIKLMPFQQSRWLAGAFLWTLFVQDNHEKQSAIVTWNHLSHAFWYLQHPCASAHLRKCQICVIFSCLVFHQYRSCNYGGCQKSLVHFRQRAFQSLSTVMRERRKQTLISGSTYALQIGNLGTHPAAVTCSVVDILW